MITVCHHSASFVMPNGDPRDRFFQSHLHNHDRFLYYLTFKEANVATISVAPIHLVVLNTFPPSCSLPCLSKPLAQAVSISCCIFGIDGIRFFPKRNNNVVKFFINYDTNTNGKDIANK